MPRRHRSDSVTAAVSAAQDQSVINPPAHITLRDGDRPFWDSIISVRSSSSWNAPDLEQAAVLARCKADIESLQKDVDEEGEVIDGRTNPKRVMLEKMATRAVALSRFLHIHAEATQGESREQAKRAAPEQDAKAAARSALIPRLAAVK
jgi:hypothetical protein